HARTGRAGDAETAAEGSAEGSADAADLVLRLEGTDAESLQLGQLVQDVRGRRDRIGAQEQRQARAPGGGDEAVGQRGIAGDVAVGALLACKICGFVANLDSRNFIVPSAGLL